VAYLLFSLWVLLAIVVALGFLVTLALICMPRRANG